MKENKKAKALARDLSARIAKSIKEMTPQEHSEMLKASEASEKEQGKINAARRDEAKELYGL